MAFWMVGKFELQKSFNPLLGNADMVSDIRAFLQSVHSDRPYLRSGAL